MSKAVFDGYKRKRGKCFSDSEKWALIRNFEKYKNILLLRDGKVNAFKRRNIAWKEIVEKVNKVSNEKRSLIQIKDLWDNLLRKSKKEISEMKKKRTDDAPEVLVSAMSMKIYEILGENSLSFRRINGIESTVDSLEELSTNISSQNISQDFEGTKHLVIEPLASSFTDITEHNRKRRKLFQDDINEKILEDNEEINEENINVSECSQKAYKIYKEYLSQEILKEKKKNLSAKIEKLNAETEYINNKNELCKIKISMLLLKKEKIQKEMSFTQ